MAPILEFCFCHDCRRALDRLHAKGPLSPVPWIITAAILGSVAQCCNCTYHRGYHATDNAFKALGGLK